MWILQSGHPWWPKVLKLDTKPNMKYFVIPLLMLISFTTFAQNNSQSMREFCLDRKDPNFVKNLTLDKSNLLSFRNSGGFGGVCWWHSRFQRNALYLTYFSPKAKIPSRSEARKIIMNIRHGLKVIEIPGFHNFAEFSHFFKKEIQSELEDWQKFDGIFLGWIRGISGDTIVTAKHLQRIMDDLYNEVMIKQNIAYQKLQMKGLSAHSWLVISMKKFKGGYDLEVLDSNQQHIRETVSYRFGDTHLVYGRTKLPFTPYLERTKDSKQIRRVIEYTCSKYD
jgi:hypothetical protein